MGSTRFAPRVGEWVAAGRDGVFFQAEVPVDGEDGDCEDEDKWESDGEGEDGSVGDVVS